MSAACAIRVSGNHLTWLNEIKRKQSHNQVIHGNKYYDYLDKEFLDRMGNEYAFDYKEKEFYTIHGYEPILANMVLEKQNTRQTWFCVSDWGCKNDNVLEQMNTFNKFIDLLFSDKYKKYFEPTEIQRHQIEQIKEFNFKSLKREANVYDLIDNLELVVHKIGGTKEYGKLFLYLERCYRDIRKLEYNGIILSSDQILEEFQADAPHYPIHIYRGETTPIEWLERKYKIYPDVEIEIRVPREEKAFKISHTSSFRGWKQYILQGEEKIYKEEERKAETKDGDN